MIARSWSTCPRCEKEITPGMVIFKPYRQDWIHAACERDTERAYRRGWGPGTWKKTR